MKPKPNATSVAKPSVRIFASERIDLFNIPRCTSNESIFGYPTTTKDGRAHDVGFSLEALVLPSMEQRELRAAKQIESDEEAETR